MIMIADNVKQIYIGKVLSGFEEDDKLEELGSWEVGKQTRWEVKEFTNLHG